MIAAHLEPKGLAPDAIPLRDNYTASRKKDAAKGSDALLDAMLRSQGHAVVPACFTIRHKPKAKPSPERHDIWTDAELSLVYAHFDDPDYLDNLRPLLPRRTRRTIQNRMSRLRAEAGFHAERIATEKELRADAETGSTALLHALIEMVTQA